MADTFRADIRAGLVTATQAFVTAQPTLLNKCYPARPTSFNVPMPFAYVDLLGETATHDSGLRQRTLAPSVVFVGRPFDNEEQVAAWDILVDLLADHFTDYAHIVANTIWDRWNITDGSEDIQTNDGVRVFPSVRFTFDNVSSTRGRS